jgi:aminoglycoside phosphotransferase (APT) family kinase protein
MNAAGQPQDESGAVREDEAQDWPRLETWLRAALPALSGQMRVAQFHGGYANLTFLLRFGETEVVLRRPPLGPVPKGAHDMMREGRVLCALAPHYDRAPRCLARCDDPSVIGAPFLVMERRRGVVVRRRFPESLARFPDVERRTAFALIDALADLHRLEPGAIGLGDLGRPDGFAARQVAGWAKRWEAARDRDIPLFERIHAALERRMPPPAAVSVIHNDPKLDNCMFAPDHPDRVASLFDWDMATTGDPAFDLGIVLGYLTADRGQWGGMFSAETVAGDYPANAELVERWLARTGYRGVDAAWSEAFALWKTAVVLQQIYIRYLRGQTTDSRFSELGPRVPELIEKAAAALEGATR